MTSTASGAPGPRGETGHDLQLPAGFELLTEHDVLLEAVLAALDEVETELAEAVANTDELADTTSRHLLEAGGKRIRPLLTVLASLLGDPGVATGQVSAVPAEARRAAVVMELTHLATLYHDDVMDEAPVRRGAPAAHRLWGNSVAILAGDLLFSRASLLMASLGPDAVRVHAATFEQLVLGQLWETVGPGEDQDALEHYLRVVGGKTGSLIAAAGRLGAAFGGSEEPVRTIMRDYGRKVGVAFQLADDVIDLTSASETSGKEPGTDLRERVPTLPVLLLRRAAAGGDRAAVEAVELVDGPLETPDQLDATVRAVSSHPVIDEAWAITRDWAEAAGASLQPLPDSPVKNALVTFADFVVSRDA